MEEQLGFGSGELTQLFESMDKDGNGILDQSELTDAWARRWWGLVEILSLRTVRRKYTMWRHGVPQSAGNQGRRSIRSINTGHLKDPARRTHLIPAPRLWGSQWSRPGKQVGRFGRFMVALQTLGYSSISLQQHLKGQIHLEQSWMWTPPLCRVYTSWKG